MIIAKTQQESDLLCEQEISHILKTEPSFSNFAKEQKVNFIKQCFFELPERISLTTVKTKKYGTLVVFERLNDFLSSKFNKSCLFVYCNSVSSRKKFRTVNTVVGLVSFFETLEFEDKEISSNGIYLNSIEIIEPNNAYLLVIEKNKFCLNGVQIIYSHQLKQ